MEIQKLNIKNFGKFSEKEIILQKGINVIYGENEMGKSTIHAFLRAMLFGMERARGRASLTDLFTRYQPLENPNYYAGVMEFQSGGRRFLLERHFDKYSKKTVLTCLDDGEQLSEEQGDLEMLLEGMKARQYEDTVSVNQTHPEVSAQLAKQLKDAAAEYLSSGNEEIHLSRALECLEKKRKEVEKQLNQNMQEKKRKREQLESEASYIWRDIHRLSGEIEETKCRLQERISEEDIQIKDEEYYREKLREERAARKKWRVHPAAIAGMILLLLLCFVLLHKPWSYLWAIVIGLACGLFVWNRLKVEKKKVRMERMNTGELLGERKAEDCEKLRWKVEHLTGLRKEKEILYGNIQDQMDELDFVDEGEKLLYKKKAALELAGNQIKKLSDEMRKRLAKQFNETVSEIMNEITGGAYKKVVLDDELGVRLWRGEHLLMAEQISRGTLEQVYFALRMAAAKFLYEEEFPVILDETFVYYDDKRLGETLKWLSKNCGQVILFTCQKREMEIMKEGGISFTKI